MSTIATSAVHAALARAAEHLLSAAGPDGVVSRADIRAKLLSLQGNEQRLVDALYQFIKSRDTARSARMTKSDIDSALAHVRAELVDRFDLDKNGLSPEEAERMPELGKIAVALARELNPPPPPAPPTEPASAGASDLRGEALAQHLASLTVGVIGFDYFGSEGGEPLSPFHVAAKLSQLTPDTFSATLGLTGGSLQQIQKFEPGDRCLERLRAITEEFDEPERGAAFVNAMKANLRDISAVLLGPYEEGVVQYPAYLVGIDADGNLVGLKSFVIWT